MEQAIHHAEAWLRALGFSGDPEMADSDRRISELLAEFVPGPRPNLGTLPAQGSGPVALREMEFHSLCAHHLVPFFGTASVVYRPGSRLAGLGGIARLLHHHARRPQLQERLAAALADDLFTALRPVGLVVRLSARQMCMELRGARTRANVVVVAERGEVHGLADLW